MFDETDRVKITQKLSGKKSDNSAPVVVTYIDGARMDGNAVGTHPRPDITTRTMLERSARVKAMRGAHVRKSDDYDPVVLGIASRFGYVHFPMRSILPPHQILILLLSLVAIQDACAGRSFFGVQSCFDVCS
jgi:hypothetical protein